MQDPRLDKLADVLVRYSTGVKPKDVVSITADPLAMPLVEAIYAAVLRAGAHPFYIARTESLVEILLQQGSEAQLSWSNPTQQHAIETVDVHIAAWAEVNTRAAARVDPKRVALMQQARRPYLKTFMRRQASKELRWVGTLFPTQASAMDAEMSLSQYEDFVFRAGLLHLPDPVAAWRAVEERQQRVVDFLQGKKVVRFRAPAEGTHDGTDLTVDVSKGTWINCSGHGNFPDGEVFCGPTGVDGHVNYTFPAVYNGREVQGVRLAFKGGKVVDATATKGEDFLHQMLDQDAGARVLGEIAIGTNYQVKEFSRNILFDEKIGGTFHAAVGAGYPTSGNSNESGLHWDMICDLRRGGTIDADGEVFHKDGAFLREGWPA